MAHFRSARLLAIEIGVAVVAIGAVIVLTAYNRQGSDDRVAGWRSDVTRLVEEARRVHASPGRPAHSPAFSGAADRLAQRIPGLSDRLVVVEIQRLMAMLGDGHSLVYPAPGPRATFAMLPIEVYFFNDGLFIVDGIGSARELAGSRIVRIGSKPIDEVVDCLKPLISRDNDMGIKAFAQMYGITTSFLEACGAAAGEGPVTLQVMGAGADKRTRDVSLDAGPPRRVKRRLYPPAGAKNPVPLYLERADTPYFIQPLPEQRALYFQFNQVTNAPGKPLADFASELGAALGAPLPGGAAPGGTALIVDVRHNTGGNNMLLAPLVKTIVDFAAGDPSRRVYVLTSRSTFSAAQNFINRVERGARGVVFAGEPSMSSPNFTGEDNPVPLPFSGLTVSISNRYWEDSAPTDKRPWIAPQLAVSMSSKDWLENRDPVLTAVLDDITTRRR